ncbi:MAG TPA: hypothetical protein VHI52_20900, partial [Verrucomicrobiae bacterium]|nr:hypothetical protein [Verrucomicrobiae bacterium]
MTIWTLIRSSLRFHARAHVGVVLGAAIGSAALIGALIVGDSVRESLRARALSRLGSIHFAMATRDRFFQRSLVERLRNEHASGSLSVGADTGMLHVSSFEPISAVLELPGTAIAQGSSVRANQVNVFGVDAREWPASAAWDGSKEANQRKGGAAIDLEKLQAWRSGDTALLNEALARQLSVQPGDDILVRVRKPSALGMDAAISPRDQNAVALRLKVGAIVPAWALGDFSLSAQAVPPNNLFLPADSLAQKLGINGKANILMASSALAVPRNGSGGALASFRGKITGWLRRRSLSRLRVTSGRAAPWRYDQEDLFYRAAQLLEPRISAAELPDVVSAQWLDAEVQRAWVPEDGGLTIRSIEQPRTLTGGEYIQPSVEISSSRVFLEPAVAAAALAPRQRAVPLRSGYLTDSTNDIAFAGIVTNGIPVLTYLANLISTGERATPYSMVTAAKPPFVPADMRDDEILVNEWVAEDLGLKPGDPVHLAYYAVDSGSKLVERTNSFRVRAIVPLKGIYADRTLMPDFPGVAEAESTHDWDTGFPLVYKIRDKDELYWRRYRGTPKAFITLSAGQAMWGSRFGNLTAIRFEVPTNTFASTCRDAVYRNL